MNIIFEQTVYYFGGIINALATAFILQCIVSVINGKIYKKKTLLIAWLLFIPPGLVSQFVQQNYNTLQWVKTILISVTIFFITYFYYKTKFLKSIFNAFITVIYSAIVEMFIVVMFALLRLDLTLLISNNYSYTLIIAIFSIIQIISIYFITNSILKRKVINIGILESQAKYIIPQFIVAIVCLFPSIFLLVMDKYRYALGFIFLNLFQVLIICIVSIFNLNRSIKHKEDEQEFENTKLYNKSLLVINEKVKGIKHDMGNIVQAINGYLVLKEYDGAIKYCNNILKDFTAVNILSVLSPNIIDEPAIYGIIARKKYIAEEQGVFLSLSVTSTCKNINFPLVELSRCIGILLDNALQATLETEEKKFWIDIRYNTKIKCHIIVVGNSVKDPDTIDTIRMFEYGYSTKKTPSGIGLYEIIRFMDKYNKGHIRPEINRENKTFIQELTFKQQDNSTINE